MAVEVRVPTLGESIVEATVGKWLKRVGDTVAAGETLVDLETDKVNVEVAAEQAGVLEQILKNEGENVAVGEVIGTLGAGGAAAQN
ncbi:dihydrolipoamide succinyltransferase, partial [Kouleothrix aurantiaca]